MSPADTYCSTDDRDRAAEFTATCGTEFFIATGRARRGDPLPVAPRGRIPGSATTKQRMARKLATKTGRSVYARRKAIVEPVFGQMATLQNAKHLLLRGFEQAHTNGYCWPRATTCASSTVIAAQEGWPHSRPAEPARAPSPN